MQPTVLIIEDDAPILRLFQQIIRQAGCRPIGHENGKTSLAYLADHTPDLILLDLTLPDISGEALLDHIQSMPHLNQTPVAVVSAHPQVAPSVYSGRVVKIITKPVRPSTLLTFITELLQS